MANGGDKRPIIKATLAETALVLSGVVAPTLGLGVLARRPRMMRLAESLGLTGRSIDILRRLRMRHGESPLMLAIPGRNHAVVLSPEHVRLVLEATPEPFATDTVEKHAALAHFEPKVSLISSGRDRDIRRRFNDEALDSDRRVHRMADPFLQVIADEASKLSQGALRTGTLSWEPFIQAWYRMVRRIILGSAAAEDHKLTDALTKLRLAGNWAFLHPRRKRLLKSFHARLRAHLARAEPGSLAQRIAQIDPDGGSDPSDQVAHWLFAFDPGGMAAFRALALLAAHPGQMERAQTEITSGAPRSDLPFLRACFLESLRLWPTTPAILRETTRTTQWDTGEMPARTSVLIFAPLFHRDEQRLEFAHSFSPDVWLGGCDGEHWPLVPFSGGPGKCPAHNLVPMVGGAFIATLMERADLRLAQPDGLSPAKPLPALLDNYSIAFSVSGR